MEINEMNLSDEYYETSASDASERLLASLEALENEPVEDFVYDEKEDPTPQVQNLFRSYVESIKKYEVLPKEEINRLGAILLREPDASGHIPTENERKQAKEKLINHHLKFVICVIFREKSSTYNILDIMNYVQEGNEALLDAVENWDYHKALLTTYASYKIKYRILPLFPKACPDEEERKERLSKESSKDKQSNMKREWAKADFQKATGINAVHLYNAKYDSDTYYNEVIPDSSAATPEEIYIKKEDSINSDQFFKWIKELSFDDPIMQFIHEEYAIKRHSAYNISKKLNISEKEMDDFLKKYNTRLLNMLMDTKKIEEPSEDYVAKLNAFLKMVPSGETTYLNRRQSSYNMLFQNEETTEYENCLIFWNQKRLFSGTTFERKAFLREMNKIKSIPLHRYIVRYLLHIYGIEIGKMNEKCLWDFMKNENWSVKAANALTSISDLKQKNFTEKDCYELLCYLYKQFQIDYEMQGILLKNPSTTFIKLINRGIGFNQFARVYQMDADTYLVFRKKGLKLKETNYLDRNFIFTYLTLKYAEQCGYQDFERAYQHLTQIYSDENIKSSTEQSLSLNNTIALGNEFTLQLDENGILRRDYQQTLFTKPIANLRLLLVQQTLLKQQKIARSYETEFQAQWTEFVNKTELKHTQKVKRFLYGPESEKLSASTLDYYSDRTSNSFLHSKEFANTYIDNNALTHQFSKFDDESCYEKRNILLTLLFLNYAHDLQSPEHKRMSYQERLAFFEIHVAEPLNNCGFMMLHSSNGYDAFLKLLLTSSDPLVMFRGIWKVKIRDTRKKEANAFEK